MSSRLRKETTTRECENEREKYYEVVNADN